MVFLYVVLSHCKKKKKQTSYDANRPTPEHYNAPNTSHTSHVMVAKIEFMTFDLYPMSPLTPHTFGLEFNPLNMSNLIQTKRT